MNVRFCFRLNGLRYEGTLSGRDAEDIVRGLRFNVHARRPVYQQLPSLIAGDSGFWRRVIELHNHQAGDNQPFVSSAGAFLAFCERAGYAERCAEDSRPSTAGGASTDVREAIRDYCPRCFQGALTRITGKALPGQPLRRRAGAEELMKAVAWFAAGLLGAAWLVTTGRHLAFLPAFWMMTVHGARTLQVQMIHQAAHGTLVGTKNRPLERLNHALGHLLSIVLLVEGFESYRRSHLHDHHHPRRLSTAVDPTVRLLQSVGLRPGLPVDRLWIRLLISLVSPVFHARRVLARLRSQLGDGPWPRRATALAYLGTLIGLAVAMGNLPALLLAWFVPLFPLYEVSATLRLCVEHEWPAELFARHGQVDHLELTHAVFCGARPPAATTSALARVGWAARMAGHALVRFLVLVGDTPCHDYHHRHPQDRDWPNVIIRRQRDSEAEAARGRAVYTEHWGLCSAIQAQFAVLASYQP